jgi:hypothetical protein
VAFHVEISAGMHRARVFNLNRADLTAKVLEPWLGGRRIEMGDREWEPRDSSLKVLEGPEMGSPDLAFGQGWANAERGSENVTRRLLEEAPPPSVPDAFVVETELPEATVVEMLAGQAARPIAWSQAQARLDGRDSEIAAVILVVKR